MEQRATGVQSRERSLMVGELSEETQMEEDLRCTETSKNEKNPGKAYQVWRIEETERRSSRGLLPVPCLTHYCRLLNGQRA